MSNLLNTSQMLNDLQRQQKEAIKDTIRKTLGLPLQSPSLRELRDRLGISQKEAAEFLGVTTMHYSNCERGKFVMGAHTCLVFEMLCKELTKSTTA